MKKYYNYLIKSEFTKNTVILSGGILIAQLIPILLQPILRRVFTPSDFGLFAIYLSIIGILTVIASLRYENAIILPKKDSDAANILSLSVILNIIFNFIIFIIIILFHSKIACLLKIEPSKSYILYFIPFVCLLFVSFQIINFWFIRKKAFIASSSNKIARRISEGITQILSGFYLKTSIGLIIGDAIGNLTNVIYGIHFLFKKGFSLKMISKAKMIALAKKYADFPKYNLTTSLLSTIGFYLPILIINQLFDKTTLGYFDLSRLVLSIPMALISTTLAQVLLQKLTDKVNTNQSFIKQISKLFIILLLLAILEIIIIQIWGVKLFSLIFGNNWQLSGEYSKILVINYALNFLAAPFSATFIALQRLKTLGIWQFLYFLSILSLFIIPYENFMNFMKIYVIIDIFAYTIYLYLVYNCVSKYEKTIKENGV
jgi:O-antigen/teichoic acid export membrane protein